jgi:hypothetical protein
VGLTQLRDSFKCARKSRTDSQEQANIPQRRVMLNGEPLPTSFVSKDELKAIIPPEAIPTAGTYIVTLKCEGEAFPESHRAHLVVGFGQ